MLVLHFLPQLQLQANMMVSSSKKNVTSYTNNNYGFFLKYKEIKAQKPLTQEMKHQILRGKYIYCFLIISQFFSSSSFLASKVSCHYFRFLRRNLIEKLWPKKFIDTLKLHDLSRSTYLQTYFTQFQANKGTNVYGCFLFF